jgi:hypothetical protein
MIIDLGGPIRLAASVLLCHANVTRARERDALPSFPRKRLRLRVFASETGALICFGTERL